MPKVINLTDTLLQSGVYVKDFAYTKNGRKYWNCICPYDNQSFICASSHLLSKTRPTLSCGCLQKKRAGEILKKYRYDHTIDLSNQRFGKLIVIKRVEKPDSVNSNRQYAFWLCQCDCGNTCIINGTYLRSGETASCGCLKSKGENKVEQILKENKIPFEKEKTFETCKDKSLLPFDFYIDNKYLIEYDGEQHFNKGGLWNQNFNYINNHDNIKNQWCKDNNISLIRIPYTHYDKICIEDLKLETSKFII